MAEKQKSKKKVSNDFWKIFTVTLEKTVALC